MRNFRSNAIILGIQRHLTHVETFLSSVSFLNNSQINFLIERGSDVHRDKHVVFSAPSTGTSTSLGILRTL